MKTRHARISAQTANGLAVLVFLSAVLAYMFGRSFVPAGLPGPFGPMLVLGPVGDVLPSFAHTYAFVIWLTIASGTRRVGAIRVAIIWALVESGFEFVQLGSPGMTARMSGPVMASPMADVAQLLTAGVFDIGDIGAIWVGASAAVLTFEFSFTVRRGSRWSLKDSVTAQAPRPELPGH